MFWTNLLARIKQFLNGFIPFSSPTTTTSLSSPTIYQLRLPNELLSELVDWLPMSYFIGNKVIKMSQAIRNIAMGVYLDRQRNKFDIEVMLFSARCKLYHYDKETKKNKKRCLGEIMLLFNLLSKRYRSVMYHKQVKKLCANLPIYPELKLVPRPQMPTVYTWACKDFSEDLIEGTNETFSARFKDAEIALQFYIAMMEVVEQCSTP